MFGQCVNVLHCCVHIARNIQHNTGAKSDLLCRLWTMRFARTEASERSFMDALERLHASKRSMFTTLLTNSLDSFLPSRINNALDVELFPEINTFKNVAFTSHSGRPRECACVSPPRRDRPPWSISSRHSFARQYKHDRGIFQHDQTEDSFKNGDVIGHLQRGHVHGGERIGCQPPIFSMSSSTSHRLSFIGHFTRSSWDDVHHGGPRVLELPCQLYQCNSF